MSNYQPVLPPRSKGVQSASPRLPERPKVANTLGGPTLPVKPLSAKPVFLPKLPNKVNPPSLPARTSTVKPAALDSTNSVKRRTIAKYESRDFSIIDSYVKELPSYTTIKELSYALTCHFTNAVDRARAIFSWIAFNIRYDADSFLNNRVPPQTPQATFQNKLAVCSGYARLYQELADLAGLQCVSIGGMAKGFGFDPSKPQVKAINHEWNAIYVENEWRMIESTWGAGYIDTEFHFKFTPAYFLVDPDEFIYEHMPIEDHHQFTTSICSWEQFFALTALKPTFWQSGIELLNHTNCGSFLQASPGDELSIRLVVPNTVKIHSVLQTPSSRGQSICLRSKSTPDTYHLEIRARVPQVQSCDLLVLYKPASAPGEESFSSLFKYSVGVSMTQNGSAVPAVLAFPMIYGSLYSMECSLHSPLFTPLPLRTTQEFTVEDVSLSAPTRNLPLYLWLGRSPGPQLRRTMKDGQVLYTARHHITDPEEIKLCEKKGNSFTFLGSWQIG